MMAAITRGFACCLHRHLAPSANALLVSTNCTSLPKTRYHYVSTHVKHADALDLEAVEGATIKPFSEMPGPKGLPLIGTLLDYLKNNGLAFKKIYETKDRIYEEYGPVCKETIGNHTIVYITDLEEYKKVMQQEGRCPVRPALGPMVFYRNRRGIGPGLVNSTGEDWYRARSVFARKLMRPKVCLEYLADSKTVANDFIEHSKKIMTADHIIENLQDELMKWALESICTVAMAERVGCLDDSPEPWVEQYVTNLKKYFAKKQLLMFGVPVYKFFPTETWKEYEKASDIVTTIAKNHVEPKIDRLIKQARFGVAPGEKEEQCALMSYVLGEGTLSVDEAKLHFTDMLLGSIDTTCNVTQWTLYSLSRNPEVQEALYQSVKSDLPNDQPITEEIMTRKLAYVKACVKESFRLYPVAIATSRLIPHDTEIGDYLVPKGTHVQANLFSIGRSPRYFENPERFQPERWLKPREEAHHYNTLSTLWFGHGARQCIGRRIAEQEIVVLLTKIIQNFHLEPACEEEVELDMNTILTPDRPVLIRFIPRSL